MRWTLASVLGVWTCVYAALAVLMHLNLRTNAYDLSVFDYALWSTANGQAGYVPFVGHSLFAEHFMPTLALLLPIYSVASTPWILIAAQLAVTLAAAALYWRLIPAAVPSLGRIALLMAFLFSRRSHSAFASFYYVESFEPALLLMMIVAADSTKWRKLYWPCLVLALGCKEDVAIYVAVYGLIVAWRGDRERGILTTAVAVAWFAFALLVAIPYVRAANALPPDNPFVARYIGEGNEGVSEAALNRLVSTRSLQKLAGLTGSTGFLCVMAPSWLLVAAPGVALNLSARTDALQAGLVGHYLWPILPWLFLAAAGGASWLCQRWRRASNIVFVLVIAVTVADAPAPKQLWAMARTDGQSSSDIRRVLGSFDVSQPVAAMPNLVPHLPHSRHLTTLGRGPTHLRLPAYVLLSRRGDLWPFSTETLESCIDDLRRREDFDLRTQGELLLFARRPGLERETALPESCRR